MDGEMIKAVNNYSSMEIPHKPTFFWDLFARIRTSRPISRWWKKTQKHTQEGLHVCKSKEESDELWGARKQAFWAAQSADDDKEIMATVLAVPISRWADCIMETKKELDQSFLFAPIVGHVGDGNFRTVIVFDPKNPVENEEAHRLNHSMVHRAINMEGTCTGEHGIGIGKKEYRIPELGEGSVELMKRVKRALDPKNILNPGKLIDIE